MIIHSILDSDHLFKTLSQAYWPVAGMDLLLFSAGLARRLGPQPPATAKAAAGTRQASRVTAREGAPDA